MSTIYVRNGIWYFQYYQNGQKKKKSLKTKDKATAKRLKVLWDAKLEQRATGLTPKKIFLSDALNRLYESKIPTLKPSGKAFYENLIRHLSEICQTIQELSPEVISNYCQKRKKEGSSLTSVYKEISLLKRAINFLIRCGDIISSPVTEWPVIKQIPKHPERIGFYTKEEVSKLKSYFSGSNFEGLFLFALYTGCRKSELYGMTINDINLEENYIKLNVKKTATNSETSARFISIHPALKEYFARKKLPAKGLLFPEIKKHAYDWPHKQIRKACKFLGIQYRRFHGLRHTAATYLLHSGVDLRTVMDILGWKNLETAQRYLHHVRTMKAAEQISSLPY